MLSNHFNFKEVSNNKKEPEVLVGNETQALNALSPEEKIKAKIEDINELINIIEKGFIGRENKMPDSVKKMLKD